MPLQITFAWGGAMPSILCNALRYACGYDNHTLIANKKSTVIFYLVKTTTPSNTSRTSNAQTAVVTKLLCLVAVMCSMCWSLIVIIMRTFWRPTFFLTFQIGPRNVPLGSIRLGLQGAPDDCLQVSTVLFADYSFLWIVFILYDKKVFFFMLFGQYFRENPNCTLNFKIWIITISLESLSLKF